MVNFTVIIATYNAQDYIESTLKSVIDQGYQNLELVIVDGFSTDQTLEIIHKYSSFVHKVVSEKDKGIYDAWNKGVRMSSNEWILFLGSGDTLTPGSLNRYADYLANETKKFHFVSSRINLVNSDGEITRLVGKAWSWNCFRKYMCTSHVAALHNRSLFKDYGYYDSSLRIVGDYELLLRAQDNLNAGFVDFVQANMLIGGVSNNLSSLRETLAVKIKCSDRGIFGCFLDYYYSLLVWILRNVSIF
jgi:glycosyltransferase involved in cell wall biosynthesis